MTQPLERRDREVGCGHLKREALAHEARELRLMRDRVEARHHPTGAVAEQEGGESGVTPLRERHHRRDVLYVLRHRLEVESLAVRTAAPAQVEGIGREAS